MARTRRAAGVSTAVVAGAWPDALLGSASRHRRTVTILTDTGRAYGVDVARWHAAADEADLSVLERAVGPVLDIGCGPGRILQALGSRDVPAFGIDVSAAAVRAARARGAAAGRVDVFGAVPGAGRWSTALLLDGNVGIGGDPDRLLRRVRELTGPRGRVLLEAWPEPVPVRSRLIRVAHRGLLSDWFPWALVTVEQVADHAAAAGWRVADVWRSDGRCFVALDGQP